MNKQALTVGMQEWYFDVDLFRVGNYLACYSEQWSMTDERNHRLVLLTHVVWSEVTINRIVWILLWALCMVGPNLNMNCVAHITQL